MDSVRQWILGWLPTKIEEWAVVLSTWITLQLSFIFLNSTNFDLANFNHRAVGIVVLYGVDASKRTSTYIKTIVIIILLIFFLMLLFQKIVDHLYAGQAEQIRGEKTHIFTISALGVFSLLLSILANNASLRELFPVLNFLLIFEFLFLFAKRIPRVGKYLSDPNVYHLSRALMIFLPIAVIFFAWVVRREKFIFTTGSVAFYFILMLVTLAAYALLVKLLSAKKLPFAAIHRAIAWAVVPLLLIPFSIPVANEIQYILAKQFHSARIVSVLIMGLLAFAGLSIFLLLLRRPGEIHMERMVSNLYFPIIVATLCIYFGHEEVHNLSSRTYYEDTGQVQLLQIDQFDLFHQGEDLVVNQQLFEFSKIPFIDIYPTHGISSVVPQMLYSIFHGYQPIEAWLWNWIVFVIGGVLLYFLFKALFSPEIGFLAAIVIPFGTIFPPYYLVAILPALVVVKVLSLPNPNKKHFALLWVTCLGMILWRVDFGIAALAAAVCLLIGRYLHQFFCNELQPKEIRRLALSTGGIFGGFALLFVLIAGLRGQSPIDILVQNYLYVTFQATVQAFGNIYNSFDVRFFVQFLIIPGVSIFYLVYFIVFYIIQRGEIEKKQLILVFIAIFSIIMSIRSTQRHSLAIGIFNPFLSLILLGCIYLFIRPKQTERAFMLLLAMCLGYFLIFPASSSVSFLSDSVQAVSNTEGEGRFILRHWQQNESRVIVKDTHIEPVKKYLEEHLEDGQTFYDFSSHSMLYVLTNREFVTYFVPTVYNSSDQVQDIQLKNMKKMVSEQKLPYVVFKNGSRWDILDGVPNELRSYRLAEFIYENYTPDINIGNYEVWRAKNSTGKRNGPAKQMEVIIQPKTTAGLEIAYRDLTIEEDKTYSFTIHAGSDEPYFYRIFDQGRAYQLDPAKVWILRMKCKSSLPGPVRVYYRYEKEGDFHFQNSAAVVLNTDGGEETLEVPIIVPFGLGRLADIRIDPPKNSTFKLRDLEILSVDSTPIDDFSQNFALSKLPYIWGNFDAGNASTATPVQAKLLNKRVDLGARDEIVLPLPETIDRSTGNYLHFIVRSDQASTVTFWYGKQGNQSSLSSMSFDVMPSTEPVNYLVRVSAQWSWMAQPADTLWVTSNKPVEIEQIYIRKGD